MSAGECAAAWRHPRLIALPFSRPALPCSPPSRALLALPIPHLIALPILRALAWWFCIPALHAFNALSARCLRHDLRARRIMVSAISAS